MQYQHFSKYVLRAPLFPLSFFYGLTENKSISESDLKEVCQSTIIKEALFLASPSLYKEFQKWMNDEIKHQEDKERICHTILKYISRMSSRCTPFGLFAGTAIGTFDKETTVQLFSNSQHHRHTRLDMNYLVALSQDLIKEEQIREQLHFYPNSSIYRAGDQLRYVEYVYENSRRTHHIVGVSFSEYLELILNKAQEGALLSELAGLLVDDDITYSAASGFIEELVDSQLLISELEPSVSGPEFMDQMLKVLEKLQGVSTIVEILKQVQQKLQALDDNIGNTAQDYIDLSEMLKPLKTGFELKYLFQTDMSLSSVNNSLNQQVVGKVKKVLRLFNKLSVAPKETFISQFGAAFSERYESREVPLAKALDVELGIGFVQNQDSGDVSPLIDDLVVGARNNNSGTTVQLTRPQMMLQKKLIQAIGKQEEIIVLNDADVMGFEEQWDDLPDTMSTMIEIVKEEDKEKIIIGSVGGSSAANLLGRFCHGEAALEHYVNEIIAVETKINKNKILAEIVHLPESRVGNILMRPAFRNYEIPYLAKSVLPVENQILIDDLFISVQRRSVKLRSKKHNKEVVPHLTNAHNYSSNALPIYQFLANMQTEGKRSGLGFNWGGYERNYDFIPRVEYHDMILFPKTWNIKKNEVITLIQNEKKEDFEEMVNAFCLKRNLPQFVLLKDGDNELLINMKNSTSVKMLLSTIKKRSNFQLIEFLHSTEAMVNGDQGAYTNQLILSFYNEERLKKAEGDE